MEISSTSSAQRAQAVRANEQAQQERQVEQKRQQEVQTQRKPAPVMNLQGQATGTLVNAKA